MPVDCEAAKNLFAEERPVRELPREQHVEKNPTHLCSIPLPPRLCIPEGQRDAVNVILTHIIIPRDSKSQINTGHLSRSVPGVMDFYLLLFLFFEGLCPSTSSEKEKKREKV